MSTNTFLTFLAGASLAVALAGCEANDDPYANQEPYADEDEYAEQQPEPMDESTATGNLREPGSTNPSVASERTDSMQPGAGGAMSGAASGLAEADVIGQPVLSQDGEEIGTIAMVVADGNGESEFAVVEVGEFLGIGHKQVAIDVRHLSLTADGKVQSNVTADAVESMPEYEAADYEEESEEEDAE